MMNRRNFVGMLSGGLAAFDASSLVAMAADLTPGGRPNFLFLIADDLTFRAIGNPDVRTPNLDRLAKSGCTFTHCFHQGGWSPAVCVPSRAMLNSGLTTFKAKDGIEHVPTWGQTMAQAGYDTFIAGKWHLSASTLARSFKELGIVAPGFLPSTDAAYNRPSPGNTWEPWDTSLKGHWLHTDLWSNPSGKNVKGHWPHGVDSTSQPPDAIEHSSIAYADCAIAHLKGKAATSNTPFFMYVGFNAPHDPRQAPKEFLDQYPQESIAVPPNFLPEHPFNEGQHHLRDETLAPFPRTKEAVQLHRREYYAIITHMDQQIGRILDALQESGRAANTYVILTADHGLCVGEHGLMGKQNQYDASMRIPLMIAGPGLEARRVVDENVYQHSLFATTCELAGISVPSTVEFPSLKPLLHGETKPIHDAMFCRYMDFQRAVRTKTHKLIFYPQIQRTQVFDLVNDPWEIHDLADDPATQSLKAELWARLEQFQHELGDPLDLLHPTPVPVTKDT